MHRTGAGASTLPPAVHTTAAELVQQVRTLGDSTQRVGFELRLDPPELGNLRIFLAQTDGTLTVLVNADRADTDQLMRRHADALLQALRENGFSSVSLDFQTAQERADQSRPNLVSDNDVDSADHGSSPISHTTTALRSTGLDRRV